jgi:hypothetical protein
MTLPEYNSGKDRAAFYFKGTRMSLDLLFHFVSDNFLTCTTIPVNDNFPIISDQEGSIE